MLTKEYFSKNGKLNWGIRIARHLLFWTAHVLYHVATWGVYEDEMQRTFVANLLSLIGKIPFTYFLIYWLLPDFLLKKKYRAFITRFLVGMLLAGLLNRAISFFVVYPIYFPDAIPYGYWRIKIFFEMASIYTIAAIALAIKLLQYWYQNERSREQLAQEKLGAELQLLKSQLHPHFLFNTLNNLYALTLEQSKTAPEVVLKLSALLNYMLYDCNTNRTTLEKEITYLKNYIELEKLRYGQRLDIILDISGNQSNKKIAPLLLIPFVENSFKHGVSQAAKQPWIKLHIWINQDQLIFQLENSLPTDTPSTANYTKGIGLKNVKRRLALLYKGKYELSIRAEDTFLVNLKLQLF